MLKRKELSIHNPIPGKDILRKGEEIETESNKGKNKRICYQQIILKMIKASSLKRKRMIKEWISEHEEEERTCKHKFWYMQ